MAQVADTPPVGSEVAKGRTQRKLVIAVFVLLVAGAVAYLTLFQASGEAAKPKPGEVVTLDPIQVNLAHGRYLRIGIALQLTEETTEVDGSEALDATIAKFSGQPVAALSDPERRQALKTQLERKVVELYDDEVMRVYFVDFVTQ